MIGRDGYYLVITVQTGHNFPVLVVVGRYEKNRALAESSSGIFVLFETFLAYCAFFGQNNSYLQFQFLSIYLYLNRYISKTLDYENC